MIEGAADLNAPTCGRCGRSRSLRLGSVLGEWPISSIAK
jgi:hypothetical protein